MSNLSSLIEHNNDTVHALNADTRKAIDSLIAVVELLASQPSRLEYEDLRSFVRTLKEEHVGRNGTKPIDIT